MTIRISSGLKNYMLGSGSLVDALTAGVIHVYSGDQPATADHAATGTYLGAITTNGEVFTHGSPQGGLIFLPIPTYNLVTKFPDDQWVLTGSSNSGVAGWWRFKANSPFDNDEASTTLARIDGAIGTHDMLLSNPNIVPGGTLVLDSFSLKFSAIYPEEF